MASRIDRQAYRDRYATNFFAFVREVLEYRDLRVNPHWEVCEFLAKSAGDGSSRSSNVPMFDLRGGSRHRVAKKHKAIFLPRNSFKSTILSAAFPVWRWTTNPKLRVLVASHNTEKASEFLSEIKSCLHRPRFKALYGDLGRARDEREGIWSNLQIQLYDPAEKAYVPFRNMYNCRAVGGRVSKAGLHPDIFIGDDLVTEENVRSDDQIEATKRFLKYMEPLMGPGTEVYLAGTFYHFFDAYQDVLKDQSYDIMLRSARNQDGSLWFPDRLTYEFLKGEEARLGPYEFGCQYLLTPIHPDEAKFKPEWIKAAKYGACPCPKDKLVIEVWVDPAATAKRTSDFSSIHVTGMDPMGTMWVLRTVKERMEPEPLISAMVDLYCEWGAEALNCEEQAAFTFIRPMVERVAAERAAQITYRPYKQSTKESKDYRILSLVPLVRGGRIRIQEDMTDLLSDFARYPHCKKDALDNLASAAARMSPPIEHKIVTPEFREKIMKEYRNKQMLCPEPDYEGERPFFTNVFYG